MKKIKEKYVEKGYYLADVTYRIDERPDNQVDVVYVIDERAKVQVKEVRFLGNGQVPDSDLLAVMQTRPGSYLSFLSQLGTYREEAFQHDLQGVQAVYLDRGYVNVKVGTPSVALTPDKRFLHITIPIEEGEQYRVNGIHSGELLLAREPVLRRVVRTKEGTLLPHQDPAGPVRRRRRLPRHGPRLRERVPPRRRTSGGAHARPHVRDPARARRCASSGSRSSATTRRATR